MKKETDQHIDSLFAEPMGMVPEFSFDESVVSVFTDMIKRSVPGYSTVIAVCGVLADRFSVSGTRLYDLGCSLGATSLVLAENAADGCEIVAVDNSSAMLKQFNKLLQQHQTRTRIETRCEGVEHAVINNASVVALNYTLQFVPVGRRTDVLATIYQGMNQGGVLILSEKILFQDPSVNDLFVDLHHEFKRSNGYSDLEISQKREAIEEMLKPETLAAHKQRLQRCGFSRVEVWFQCLNFASIVAFK